MTTTVAKKHATNVPLAAWIGLLIVGLGGLGWAWGLQLTRGMDVTSLGQRVVWGLYIAGFFAAMGTGAALVILATAGEFFSILPVARKRSALLLALVCYAVGGVLITMDVGNPANIWRILTAGRLTSMMTWDFWALLVAGLLALVYLIANRNPAGATPGGRVLGLLASLGAAMLVIVEGWMLATLSAHPLWDGGLTVLSFLVAAFVAGLAAGILAWPEVAEKWSKWLATGLWVTLAMTLIEMLTGLIQGSPRPQAEINLLLFGGLSPLFWAYLIAGLLLPLAILLWQKGMLWLRLAAALAFLGVILEKLWLLAAGQALPWLALPEDVYRPAWIEWVGLVGAVAFAALLYLLVAKFTKVDEYNPT